MFVYSPTRLLLSMFLVCILCAVTPSAAITQTKQDKVKAVFLFTFFKYITWPASAGRPRVICVVGDHPFGGTLDYIAKNKFASSSYQVHYPSNTSGLSSCHVVFANDNIDSVIQATNGKKGMLTVSDSSGFASLGGGIEFVDRGGKIDLVLNPNTLKQAGLKANAKLMKIVIVTN